MEQHKYRHEEHEIKQSMIVLESEVCPSSTDYSPYSAFQPITAAPLLPFSPIVAVIFIMSITIPKGALIGPGES